jgi:hypothetical protein
MPTAIQRLRRLHEPGGKVRTRGADPCAGTSFGLSPVMRTHEGNRPDDNLQVDSTPELLATSRAGAGCTGACALCRATSAPRRATGLPAQRPLFLHYRTIRETAGIQDQFSTARPDGGAGRRPKARPSGVSMCPAATSWRDLWSGRRGRGRLARRSPAPIGRRRLRPRRLSAFAPVRHADSRAQGRMSGGHHPDVAARPACRSRPSAAC